MSSLNQAKGICQRHGETEMGVHPENSSVEVRRLCKDQWWTRWTAYQAELWSQPQRIHPLRSRLLWKTDKINNVTHYLRVGIMDPDSCTTQYEERDALKQDYGDGLRDCKVFITRPNACKQWLTVADFTAISQKLRAIWQ